ncbi:MAG TPA: DUF1206 domain-containing protein [Chryseosolibacter sp.]|nr:DUF1206 domain-containing protein [Chryseosolibacter sp.]
MSSLTSAFGAQSREAWFEKFARFGLVSKGVVYFLMGGLSVLAAFGLSSEKGDKSEAFKLIYEQPYGRVILIAIAIGLLGYVMLRLMQAFKNTENKGKDLKGTLDRIGYGMSALMYLGIGIYAMKLVLQGASSDQGDSRQFIVSKIFEYPGGEYIVGIASLIVIGMGIYQIARGVTGKFMKRVNLYNSNMKDAFKTAGVIGYISRGIVLGIIGYFLFHAAWLSNPNEAKGTGAAFDFLQNTFGSLMMALVAIGLAAYGVFCFVKAKYQRIDFDFD